MAQVILVAIDFETASMHALELAREMAPRLDAEVVLLHVCPLPIVTYPGLEPTAMPTLHTEVAMAARRALQQTADDQGGLRAVLRQGDPAQEIVAEAEAMRPALLVLGTHGRKGLGHLLLGSVAEKVVRQSPVPVLTVRSGPEKKAA
jgi:nucleotide-binding universal stress UspA family protein